MKYFAYGSNMLTQRLTARVSTAANPLPFALHGYTLHFHKKSVDQSGKCNIVKSASDEDILHGVIFDVADQQIGVLDDAEGVGQGYRRDELPLELNDIPQKVFVYVAELNYINAALQPYRWYYDLVLAGAEQHSLPEAYRAKLSAVPFVEDPDQKRKTRLEAVAALKAYATSKENA